MDTQSNRYSVTVKKVTTAGHDPAQLETKAHTLQLGPDGTLTVAGEKQRRAFPPGEWDSLEVRPL